jgi:hypothetical protein
LGKIFNRWIETSGRLPSAKLAASVSAYLYDASCRHNVILSNEDRASFITRPEWLAHVRLPEVSQVPGQPVVTFWWVGPRGVSRMRIYLAEGGRIRTEETFIQEFLNGKGKDS